MSFLPSQSSSRFDFLSEFMGVSSNFWYLIQNFFFSLIGLLWESFNLYQSQEDQFCWRFQSMTSCFQWWYYPGFMLRSVGMFFSYKLQKTQIMVHWGFIRGTRRGSLSHIIFQKKKTRKCGSRIISPSMNVFLSIFCPQLVRTATVHLPTLHFPPKVARLVQQLPKSPHHRSLSRGGKRWLFLPYWLFTEHKTFSKPPANSFSRHLTPYVTCLNPCILGTGKGNGLAVSMFTPEAGKTHQAHWPQIPQSAGVLWVRKSRETRG